MRRSLLLGAACIALSGCGGGAGGAPPPAAPSSSPPPAAAPASSPPPAAARAPGPSASDAPSAADTAAEAPAPPPDEPDDAPADDTTPRKKLYRTTPRGLVVEMAGVLFRINAKAVRRGAGWGVKVMVTAKSKDEQAHVLLSPKHGPLAFSAKVDRGGKVDKLGDARKGDKMQTVDPDKPLTLSRTWPGGGARPVTAGQSLDLQVGLWGLGPDAHSQRPVRRFFEVKMVLGKGKKPQAVVSPPASAQ